MDGLLDWLVGLSIDGLKKVGLMDWLSEWTNDRPINH